MSVRRLSDNLEKCQGILPLGQSLGNVVLVDQREKIKEFDFDDEMKHSSLFSLVLQGVRSGAFLPSATEVAERLCFHRCLSVHGKGEVYTPC